MKQETLNALRLAGMRLAPLLEVETDQHHGSPNFALTPSGWRVFNHVGPGYSNFVQATSDTLDAAFEQFLANRSDKLAQIAREKTERAAFEAWQAQQGLAA